MIKNKISRRNFVNAGLLTLAIEPFDNSIFKNFKSSTTQNSIYLKSEIYDVLPNYIVWDFDGVLYSNPIDSRSLDFNYKIMPLPKTSLSLSEAIQTTIQKIDKDRRGATVALLYSGGIDSEIIAAALNHAGIPFELYFVNFWGLNLNYSLEHAKWFSKKVGKSLRVVDIDKANFFSNHLENTFMQTGCAQPTYLVLSMALSQLPTTEFIVTGEGGFDKQSMGYIKAPQVTSTDSISIPVKSGEIFYRIWAQKNKRAGQYYFYNSTPEILNSVLYHPKMNLTYPFYDTTEALRSAFTNIKPRLKTTNWENNEYEHKEIRKAIKEIAKNNFGESLSFNKIGSYTITHI
jgi:asparagine synthetase B (glutamine-hydrolysing)